MSELLKPSCVTFEAYLERSLENALPDLNIFSILSVIPFLAASDNFESLLICPRSAPFKAAMIFPGITPATPADFPVPKPSCAAISPPA